MLKLSLKRQQGFTLIELMLVIAFLGTLMLVTSSSIMQAINIYNKGVAIKQINQAGRALVEDINRLSSSGAEVEILDNGTAGCLRIGFTGSDGRVFLWNSLEKGKGGTAPSPSPTDDKKWEKDGQEISLVRSNQNAETASYCYLPSVTVPGLSAADAATMTSVLNERIAVLSVDITESTDSSLKKIAFWIGTGTAGEGGQQINFDTVNRTWSCPGGFLGEFCAVSKFETVIYVPNTKGTP